VRDSFTGTPATISGRWPSGAIHFDQHLAGRVVRVGDDVPGVLDAAERNDAAKRSVELGARLAGDELLDRGVERVAMLLARKRRAEARVGHQISTVHDLAQPFPGALLVRRERNPAVACAEEAERRKHDVARAGAAHRLTGSR
jgi:hypothetical protein